MKLTEEIIKILSCLGHEGDFEFVSISENDILLNEHNILKKIYSRDVNDKDYFLDYQTFFQKISDSIEQLDHIGISYYCPDIEKEINFYKEIIKNAPVELVEEENPEGDSRWLFVRSKENKNAPLFEIVLAESKEEIVDEWRPHFQIDINTSLAIEELREATNRYLAPNFIKWELGVPGQGVVLAMGYLGQSGKTKIGIGLGTNKRRTDLRNKYLKII